MTGVGLQELWESLRAWLALAVPAGLICAALWWLAPRSERGLLPPPQERPLRWSGPMLFFAFCLVVGLPPAVHALLTQTGFFAAVYDSETPLAGLEDPKLLWVNALCLPLQAAVVLVALRLVHGAGPRDIGLMPARAVQDTVVGYLAWLVLTPLALVVYWVVVLVLGQQKHQLPFEPFLIVFVTVLAAPVWEELLFRGLLLPWQTHRGGEAQLAVAAAALMVAVAYLLSTTRDGTNPGPVLFVLAMLPGYALIPYLHRRPRDEPAPPSEPGQRTTSEETIRERREQGSSLPPVPPDWAERLRHRWEGYLQLAEQPGVNALLAIYGNGLLFATFHAGAWPSPIPLFLLGVGLAWLAHRTQSLVAPIVTHALFNGTACLVMFWR